MMEDLFSYYATRVKDFRDARELNKQMLRDMNRNIEYLQNQVDKMLISKTEK